VPRSAKAVSIRERDGPMSSATRRRHHETESRAARRPLQCRSHLWSSACRSSACRSPIAKLPSCSTGKLSVSSRSASQRRTVCRSRCSSLSTTAFRLMLVPTGGFGWVIGDHEVARRGHSECVINVTGFALDVERRHSEPQALALVLERGVIHDVLARPQLLRRRARATRRCRTGAARGMDPTGARRPFGRDDPSAFPGACGPRPSG
jgi:hypothetical protein